MAAKSFNYLTHLAGNKLSQPNSEIENGSGSGMIVICFQIVL
jgi:hypothetical protein